MNKILFFFLKFIFIYIPAGFAYLGLCIFLYHVFTDKPFVNLGAQYKFFEGNRTIVGKNIVIPEVIEEYKYDKRFIIALQNVDSFIEKSNLPQNRTQENYYWIIDKLKSEYYGPVDSINFVNLRDSLNISINFSR